MGLDWSGWEIDHEPTVNGEPCGPGFPSCRNSRFLPAALCPAQGEKSRAGPGMGDNCFFLPALMVEMKMRR